MLLWLSGRAGARECPDQEKAPCDIIARGLYRAGLGGSYSAGRTAKLPAKRHISY